MRKRKLKISKLQAIGELTYGAHFELEAWLRSVVELVFWLLLFLPFLVFPLLFLTLPAAFEAAGITLGTPGALQAVNLFLVALIDPVKGAPVMQLIIAEVALPLGLPPLIVAVVLILVFFWENETDKVTISKYAPLRAFKEVVVGNNEKAGILMVLPVLKRIKVSGFIGPVFGALERLKHRIAGKSSPPSQTRR